MSEYPNSHPLHGKTDEWITHRADARSENAYWPSTQDAGTLALIHEYKRLKHKDDAAVSLAECMRGLFKDTFNSDLPPSDWLTQAIDTAGAPADSDWAGLLGHMGKRSHERHELIRERDKLRERAEEHEDMLSRIYQELPGVLLDDGWDSDKLDVEVHKLRQERDEAQSSNRLMETLATDIDAEIPGPANWWGENGTVIRARKLRERADAAEARIKELESELATSNGYRTGIGNDLSQVEKQSNEFSSELNYVAGLLDESPARGVLVGPGIEDGVAFVVGKRLNRDTAQIKALEDKVIELARERDAYKSSATPTPPLERIAAALEALSNA